MISVCIATYNGEKYIKQQLDSILSQLSSDDEVIISDDSSTDNTLQIIQQMNDKRIVLLPDNQFKSPIFNIENALKRVKGDYIFLADQDDVWMQNKVAVVLRYLEVNKKVVFHNAVVTGADLEPLKKLTDWRKYVNGLLPNIIRPYYVGCCMAFHKSVLSKALPFPLKTVAHDVWIGLIGELYGGVTFIDEPLILYRRHGSNVSLVGSQSTNSIFFMISYRIQLLKDLMLRFFKSTN